MELPWYASGISETPLLGDTIGDNLDRTVAAHADREALVDVATGRRWTYARARRRRRRGRRGLLGGGHREGRPGRHLGAEPRRVGARPVRHRQDRRDPGQHQPGLPHPRAGVRAQPGGHAGCWSARRRSRPATTRRWSTRCAATARRSSASVFLGTPDWDALSPRRRRDDGARSPSVRRLLDFDDPINIQYTSGTTGSPRAPRSRTTTSSTTATSSASCCGYTEADRVCIPVPFYHCFGMVMGNLGVHHARRHAW